MRLKPLWGFVFRGLVDPICNRRSFRVLSGFRALFSRPEQGFHTELNLNHNCVLKAEEEKDDFLPPMPI